MPTFRSTLLDSTGPSRQTSGPGALQTVKEGIHERFSLTPESPNLNFGPEANEKPDIKPALEHNPSSRPLERRANDHQEAYARDSDGPKRPEPRQECDVGPEHEFKEAVAELMKEEEYGVLRLVVPHVDLSRHQFDEYVSRLHHNRASHMSSSHGRECDQAHSLESSRSLFGLPLLPPRSPFALCWTGVMMLIDLTWTAFGVPLNVAFCSVDYGKLGTGCTGTDLAFGIMYFLNLVLSFNIGMFVVNGHRKKLVMDGRRVAYYYIVHGRFALDLAASIPFAYLVVVLIISKGHGYQSKWINVLSLIRLVRLLRLVSVSKVIYVDSTLGGQGWLGRYFSTNSLYVAMVGYQISVLINLFACVLVLMAYMHGLEESWMTAVSWTDLPASPKPYQWYCAMYWVITTTTTTGFGDFAPRWWAEQVVIGLAMIAGMIAFGIMTGIIITVLQRASGFADRLQVHIRKISQVKSWLAHCKLKKEQIKRIQEYFAQVFVAKGIVEYGEAELFEDLPSYLKFEVASELATPLVHDIHWLGDLLADPKQLLASLMRPVRAVVGQELCRQGDEADRLWLLAEGKIMALRFKEGAQVVCAPSLVGESLLLSMDIPHCRPWTLRAESPCQLWEVSLADLSRVVQIYPGIRLLLLEHIRTDLARFLCDLGAGRPTEYPQSDWCEMSALLRASLMAQNVEAPGSLQDLVVPLCKANSDDWSLQTLLSELILNAMVRDGLKDDATHGLPLAAQQLAQEQQQQRRRPHSPVPVQPQPSRGTPTTIREQSTETHQGPAPWGWSTEEALAALAGGTADMNGRTGAGGGVGGVTGGGPLQRTSPPRSRLAGASSSDYDGDGGGGGGWDGGGGGGGGDGGGGMGARAGEGGAPSPALSRPVRSNSARQRMVNGAGGGGSASSTVESLPYTVSYPVGGGGGADGGSSSLHSEAGSRRGRLSTVPSVNTLCRSPWGSRVGLDAVAAATAAGGQEGPVAAAAAPPRSPWESRVAVALEPASPTPVGKGSSGEGAAGAATVMSPAAAAAVLRSPGGSGGGSMEHHVAVAAADQDPIAFETGLQGPPPAATSTWLTPPLPGPAVGVYHHTGGGAGEGGAGGGLGPGVRRTHLSRFSMPYPGLESISTGLPVPRRSVCPTCGVGNPPHPHPYPHPHAAYHMPHLQHGEGYGTGPLISVFSAGGAMNGAGAAATATLPSFASMPNGLTSAMSLTDAVRGGVRLQNGALSPMPPPQLYTLPPIQQPPASQGPGSGSGVGAQLQLPQHSQLGSPMPLPPPPLPHMPSLRRSGSPVHALGRPSRMYGRSLAVTSRMDSLVRDTLMRQTYGSSYFSDKGAEGPLGLATSEPPPARPGDESRLS